MNQQTLGHLAALFTIVNWGTTFIGTKILLTDFSPVEILVFRFMLGVVALYIMCPRLLYFKNWREELTFAGAGLTGACLYYLMENIALTFTTAANVGVIVTVAPLSTALLSWAMGEERPKGWFFLGFAVAMSGICLISFSGVSELSLDWRGDLLAVGATVVWAVYCMLLKRIGTYGYSVLQTTRRTFLYGLIFMIPAALLMDFHWGLERFANTSYVLTFLYLGIGACALCFATWGFAVKVLGVIESSVYLYLPSIVTLICSALILHEPMSRFSLLGAGLTLAGLVLSEWDSLRAMLRQRKAVPGEKSDDCNQPLSN